MIMQRVEGIFRTFFEGEVIVKKCVLWLAGVVCLLAGIVYGLMLAPWTHGVTIASNNGNQSDCCFGTGFGAEVEEDKK